MFIGNVNQSLATLRMVAGRVFLPLVTPLQPTQRGKSSAQLVPRRPAIKGTPPWHHQALLLPWPLALFLDHPFEWTAHHTAQSGCVSQREPRSLPRFEPLLSGTPRRGSPKSKDSNGRRLTCVWTWTPRGRMDRETRTYLNSAFCNAQFSRQPFSGRYPGVGVLLKDCLQGVLLIQPQNKPPPLQWS